jgi:hypothetical protein
MFKINKKSINNWEYLVFTLVTLFTFSTIAFSLNLDVKIFKLEDNYKIIKNSLINEIDRNGNVEKYILDFYQEKYFIVIGIFENGKLISHSKNLDKKKYDEICELKKCIYMNYIKFEDNIENFKKYSFVFYDII